MRRFATPSPTKILWIFVQGSHRLAWSRTLDSQSSNTSSNLVGSTVFLSTLTRGIAMGKNKPEEAKLNFLLSCEGRCKVCDSKLESDGSCRHCKNLWRNPERIIKAAREVLPEKLSIQKNFGARQRTCSIYQIFQKGTEDEKNTKRSPGRLDRRHFGIYNLGDSLGLLPSARFYSFSALAA